MLVAVQVLGILHDPDEECDAAGSSCMLSTAAPGWVRFDSAPIPESIHLLVLAIDNSSNVVVFHAASPRVCLCVKPPLSLAPTSYL